MHWPIQLQQLNKACYASFDAQRAVEECGPGRGLGFWSEDRECFHSSAPFAHQSCLRPIRQLLTLFFQSIQECLKRDSGNPSVDQPPRPKASSNERQNRPMTLCHSMARETLQHLLR